jgi:hypothetical protein
MEDTTGIKGLKSLVKLMAEEGRACRQKINATKGEERDGWWNEKRSVGEGARNALLAYGLFRGIPYERMERKCRIAPNGYAIYSLLHKHGGDEWTQERVKELLKRLENEREAA